MNIEKADIFTIAEFGNVEKLLEKLNLIGNSLSEVRDDKDKNNNTLLHKSIIGRKFDISLKLLEMDCKINCISDDGYNELHYLAYRLENDLSFDIAKKIIKKGGNINLKDKEYGNTPFNYFCQMAIRKINNNSHFKDLIIFCMNYKPDLYERNYNGKNVYEIVNNYGNTDLKEIINNFH